MILRRFLPNLKILGQIGISKLAVKKKIEISYLQYLQASNSLFQIIYLKTVFEISNWPRDFKFGKNLLRIIILGHTYGFWKILIFFPQGGLILKNGSHKDNTWIFIPLRGMKSIYFKIHMYIPKWRFLEDSCQIWSL